MNIRVSIQGIVVAICVLFTTFQAYLSNSVWSGLSYFDEVLALICFLICGIYIMMGGVSKNDGVCILLLFFLFIIGLLGNLFFNIQDNNVAILMDIIATFKNFVIYYAFKFTCTNPEQNLRTLRSFSRFFRLIVYICAPLALINLFVDFGMSAGIDFGIRNFQFIFSGAGNYALIFYVIGFVIVIDVAMKDHITQFDKFTVVLMLWAWASSLTTRSLAYVALFLLMYFIYMYGKGAKIKLRHIILMGAATLGIGYSTIVYYFSSERTTARGSLLSGAFEVFRRYFPIGSGFATYGSNMAAEYYSKLYKEFGFTNVWGLAEGNARFANDSFWPEIIGQFGFLGCVVLIVFLALFHKNILELPVGKAEKMTLQWILLVFLIGSTGTKTYLHFATIGFFIFLALYENAVRYSHDKIAKSYETT